MGVNLKELVLRKEISLDGLKGKILAIDSYNHLYQYLTTIRSADGKPLMDSKGNITSHLTGLFTRSANLMQRGIRLVFVFDGKPPELKHREIARRAEIKSEAEILYREAVRQNNIEDMRKYSMRFSKLTDLMVAEAKSLIKALGCPIVQAPSEGEAQAAHLVKKEEAFASVSQDFDSLLFGSPVLLRNISITQKKKLPGKLGYEVTKPEIIDLNESLNKLGIDNEQLIALAMLVGTDYNPGGIKGIGPKNALKLVKKHKNDFNGIFNEVKWSSQFDFGWKEVFDTIAQIPVTDDYELEWKNIDDEKIIEVLCGEHDFSRERVASIINKLKAKDVNQKGLGDFF